MDPSPKGTVLWVVGELGVSWWGNYASCYGTYSFERPSREQCPEADGPVAWIGSLADRPGAGEGAGPSSGVSDPRVCVQ